MAAVKITKKRKKAPTG